MADSLHADKGAIIRHIVKCRMYADPPLLKFFFYIPRKLDIGTIDTINLLQHGIKFIDFRIHFAHSLSSFISCTALQRPYTGYSLFYPKQRKRKFLGKAFLRIRRLWLHLIPDACNAWNSLLHPLP